MTPSKPKPPSTPSPGDPEPAPRIPADHDGDAALWGETEWQAIPDDTPTAPEPARAAADRRRQTIGHIGRYALKHRLGEGGLGTVYAAHDPLLSRLIAVKTLNLEIGDAERETFNALFLNEARAAAGLSHPHIVTVFDAGVSDNRAYIAMELLKGRDLRQLREEGWRPTPLQAALIARRVADALDYAHGKGVVHRDIKPANIFMVGRAQPKVLDFGIARLAQQHDAADAAGSELEAGSPYYMSPEQIRREPVDRRADVFALGVVLYELLTDRKPFRGTTLDEITHAVLTHQPPLAHRVETAVPEALASIVAKALAKDPEARHPSAHAFSRELRHWLDLNPGPGPGRSTLVAGRRLARGLGAATAAVLLLAAAGIGYHWIAPPGSTARHVAVSKTPLRSVASGGIASGAVASAGTASGVASSGVVAGAASSGVTSGAASSGVVRLDVAPWGELEVDGRTIGISPPISELRLPEGRHRIVVRHGSDAPVDTGVDVIPAQAVELKHRFWPAATGPTPRADARATPPS